jgi:hypothetical protein
VTGTAGNWVMTSTAGKWIMAGMAGKEIDPQRARAARDVVRQHPAIALFAASPVLIAAGLVWWLASPGWAIVLLVAALVAGGFAVVRKR